MRSRDYCSTGAKSSGGNLPLIKEIVDLLPWLDAPVGKPCRANERCSGVRGTSFLATIRPLTASCTICPKCPLSGSPLDVCSNLVIKAATFSNAPALGPRFFLLLIFYLLNYFYINNLVAILKNNMEFNKKVMKRFFLFLSWNDKWLFKKIFLQKNQKPTSASVACDKIWRSKVADCANVNCPAIIFSAGTPTQAAIGQASCSRASLAKLEKISINLARRVTSIFTSFSNPFIIENTATAG